MHCGTIRIAGLASPNAVCSLRLAVHTSPATTSPPKATWHLDRSISSCRWTGQTQRTATSRIPPPIGWTMRNRGKILCALYTILLGNPALRTVANTPPPKTRFKAWWRIIGSSIEHASGLLGKPLDFQDLFLRQEDNDEESTSLADALWKP